MHTAMPHANTPCCARPVWSVIGTTPR
jgi:hypothetical protein